MRSKSQSFFFFWKRLMIAVCVTSSGKYFMHVQDKEKEVIMKNNKLKKCVLLVLGFLRLISAAYIGQKIKMHQHAFQQENETQLFK